MEALTSADSSLISQGYGLGLFFLGAMAFVLPRRDSILPFAPHASWLAAFGFLHGLHEIISPAHFSLAATDPLDPHILLHASSFLALFEFGRRCWNDTGIYQKLPAIPVYVLIVSGLVAFTYIAKTPWYGFDVGIQYLLGVPGAVISGLTLILNRRLKLRGESVIDYVLWLWVSALGLILYALLFLFVPHVETGALPGLPTEEDFAALTGFPIYLARALFAIVVAIGFSIMIRHASRSNDESLLQIIDTVSGFIYRDRLDWRAIYMSSGVEKLAGYPASEFLREDGISFNDMIHPDDFQRIEKETWEDLNAGRDFEVSYRIINREGEVRWVFERGRGIHDQDGKLCYIDGHIADDHDRKIAEVELEKHRYHLEQLVEERTAELNQARDEVVLVVDTLTGYFYRDSIEDLESLGEDWTIPVYMTKGIKKLTGYTVEELSGREGKKVFSDLIHPDDGKQAWETVKIALEEHRDFDCNYRIFTREGEERWVYERGHGVYDASGKAIYIEGYVIDDHERKVAQAEIESQNAELERFTYTVSHDLKSPLVTIKGFLGLLTKDLADNNSERITHDIDMISTATDTMDGLLSDLLELSRAGRVMDEPTVCKLNNIVSRVIELMQVKLDELDIEVVIDDMPEVIGDPRRLSEVYQNLVENAIKFMGSQHSPKIHIGATMKDGRVECFVRDNGIGIAPEYQHLVFELFERLGSDTEGTGIGLALVKRIIEMHGGQIHIQSEGLDHGSTILFTLPASSQ